MNLKHIAIFSTLICFSACAQEPSPAVQPLQGLTGIADLTPSTTITKNAAVFSGSDFFGQSCGLALSLIEEDGKHVFLTKMNYNLHGESLPDIETGLYRFELSSNSYSDSQTGTGSLTFGGALLNDGPTVNLNELSTYEAQGKLVYSVRVETAAISATDYEEALEEVINDPSQLAAYSSTLDQVSRIVFKLSHAGHYDAAGCINLKLTNIVETEFNLGDHDDHGDDDDHDHDDHGDDHDHDHN